MPTLLIKAGRVLDPASGIDRIADVAITDGRITAIEAELDASAADTVVDAAGMLVTPGLIDPHVHLRESGQTDQEDIASGTRAAVAGGFTSVCCMPNTSPALDTPELLEFVASRSKRDANCRVFPVAAATNGRRGERLSDVRLLVEAGAVGFSDDGDVIESPAMMRKVLNAIAPTGLAMMQHCQETTLTDGAAMHSGEVAARLGLKGWPPLAEHLIIERDVRLVIETGCKYHVQHVSSEGSIEIIRRAREQNLPVTAEATPHHLISTHDLCAGQDGHSYDTNAKMSPPLREQRDVDAIRQAVADGIITVLGTDHAPHTPDRKAEPFESAPFGIIGLETALPLYAQALIDTGLIDWARLIELMTIEPARLCGLDELGLGSLSLQGPADLTIIDPELAWTCTERDLAGKGRNTPYLGRALKGRAVASVVNGRLRYDLRRQPASTSTSR